MARNGAADTASAAKVTSPAFPPPDDSASAAASTVNETPKRPPLQQRESDSQSDHTVSTTGSHHHSSRHPRQHTAHKAHGHGHHHHHPRHVGKLGARAASSKALHKQGQQHHGPPGAKLTRRITSPNESQSSSQINLSTHISGGGTSGAASGTNTHRRDGSTEDKSMPPANTTKVPKSSSHTSLRRNRSHVEVGKRNKSSEKLKRSASGTSIAHRPRSSKGAVHFALGDDEEGGESDEWVDASASNSPYMSRKGSLNSSAQSSLRQSHNVSAHATANNTQQGRTGPPKLDRDPTQQPSTPDRERNYHKAYLTSRLLQRTPSSGAPPRMTSDVAQAMPRNMSPDSTLDGTTAVNSGSGNAHDELTSRFVDTPASGMASENSFYHTQGSFGPDSGPSSVPRRPHSMANFSKAARSDVEGAFSTEAASSNSALVPRPGSRSHGPAAETSRIQQKLNLQRASSVIEPGQGSPHVQGSTNGTPLIGVSGPGYDGGQGRDHRMSKLLERTGMEYLVVRRYQNPIARSLNRLSQLPKGVNNRNGTAVPRPGTNASSAAITATTKKSLEYSRQSHVRNVSGGPSLASSSSRRPITPGGASTTTAATGSTTTMASTRDHPHHHHRPSASSTNMPQHQYDSHTGSGAGPSADYAEEHRQYSGSSLVDGEEGRSSTAALLRSMWEKTAELSASTD